MIFFFNFASLHFSLFYSLCQHQHRIPQSDLKAFRSVCKYNTPGARALENLCFLEMITLPLQGLIITHPRFPISAFGLIHVGNDKILYEAVELTPSKTFNLSASIKGYRWIENHGLEIQVLMVVKSSESNSIVWQCVTTLLSRADAKKVAKSSKGI